jgi:hypothetical protein
MTHQEQAQIAAFRAWDAMTPTERAAALERSEAMRGDDDLTPEQAVGHRVLESVDDLTPDEIARLGRVMADLMFSAWLSMNRETEATDQESGS